MPTMVYILTMKHVPPRRVIRNASNRTLAIGYTRVSTEGQALEGISLDSQCSAIQRYGDAHGLEFQPPRGLVPASDRLWQLWPMGGVLVDGGVSGGIPIDERPAGGRLMALVRSGHLGHVVVASLDRLSRDSSDLAACRKELNYHGVSLHILDLGGKTANTPAGNMVTGMMAEAAQMIRGQIREKTCSALNGKRVKSEKLGGPVPYGQLLWVNHAGVKCLKPDHNEQAIIMRARELRASGLSYRKIGAKLLEENHKPRTGGPWPHESIRRMMED